METKDVLEALLAILEEKKRKDIYEAIERFKKERITELKNDRTHKNPFIQGPKVVLHLIPYESFQNYYDFDFADYLGNYQAIRPIRFGSLDQSFGFEGLLHFANGRENKCVSYVQVYRNGIIEAVDAHEFNTEEKVIYSKNLEEKLIERANQYMAFQKEIGVNPPVFFYLSLLGVRDFRMPRIPGHDFFDNIHAIDKEDLIFPKITLNKPALTPEEFKPIFDRLWNACGYPRCPDYDDKGIWKKK